MGAVAFVLLIACANLANLCWRDRRSLARDGRCAARSRVALRIVRQLLIECVLLPCIAGIFGLALSSSGC